MSFELGVCFEKLTQELLACCGCGCGLWSVYVCWVEHRVLGLGAWGEQLVLVPVESHCQLSFLPI